MNSLVFLILMVLSSAMMTQHGAGELLPESKKPFPENPPQQHSIRPNDSYGSIPLLFEVNQGQSDNTVKFLSRTNGFALFLTSDEIMIARSERKSGWKPTAQPSLDHRSATAIVRLQFLGVDRDSQITGENRQESTSNYFINSDPANWHTHIPNFSRVRYHNLYPGIDLLFYGNRNRVEHDFVVAPGADPGAIHFAVRDAETPKIAVNGDLLLADSNGNQRLLAPQIYQEIDGSRVTIRGRYVLIDRHTIGFSLGAYDRSQALVIDPVLSYSSYFGGGGDDASQGIAVDASGNTYITGYTFSAGSLRAISAQARNLANGGGGSDVFVAKLNANGSALTYCTYLGGSGDDLARAIAIDSSGNAYITGETLSSDFPVVGGVQSKNGGGKDAFVAKLNPTGSGLTYSTYLGGNRDDAGIGIAVDGLGIAHIAGYTFSTNFPTVDPLQPTNGGGLDAFVADISATGSALNHSTYLGGSAEDAAEGIALDPSGNIYVAGYTFSPNFPTVNALKAKQSGNSDVFVAKLKASDSSLIYSTYLGGAGSDLGRGITVDRQGDAYITGQTDSPNFPVSKPVQARNWGGIDSFVTKLDPAGGLAYSTYLGGGGTDIGRSIAVDPCGTADVTGVTNSDDFLLADELQNQRGGGNDAFVAQIDASGATLASSTFLGGSGDDDGTAIAADSFGNVYVTGNTKSDDFPRKRALQPASGGGTDAFITKISSTACAGAQPSLSKSNQGSANGEAKATPLAAAAASTGTTYFVANSGSDSNDGTSSDRPWKTLAKVNSVSFSPGDTISFNRGDTWNAQTDAALIVSSSGSAGTPLTFTAYGSGNPPIIDGQNAVAFPLQTNSKSFVVIDSLQVQNASNIAIYVNNCDTCAITNNNVMNGLNYGISVAGNSPNVKISGNTYSLSASFPMVGTALDCNTPSVPSCTVTDNSIDLRNVAPANHPSGILCRKSGTCTITHNTILMANGSQGIGLKANGSTNMTGSQVIGNSISGLVYTPSCPSTTCDAEAIEITGADTAHMVTNSVVSGNYIKNGSGTSSSCIGMYYASGPNVVSYNLCIAPIGTNQNACVHATSSSINNLFYNNSCYGAAYGLEFVGASVTGNTVQNNIVVGARRGIGFYTGSTGTFDYNDVWNASLKTYEGGTDGGHNLNVDPKWTASAPASPNDFKLLSGSPLIDSGTDLGSDYQMANDPDGGDFPYTPANQNEFGSWERGAFLFKASNPLPTLDIAPGSVAFGNQRVGSSSSPSDVTLSNTSTAPLTINAITIAGPDAGEFSTTQTCGPALASGSSCVVSVAFSPTSGGSKSASVSVDDDGSGSPHTVVLSGTGSTVGVDIAPSSLTFGNQATSTSSAPQLLTLTNSGTETLNIASVEITGPDAARFSKTQTCGATLAKDASCTVSVTFSPDAPGTKSASLTITDDASGSPQTIVLSGTGTAPGLGTAPANINFGDQAVNTTSAAQSITLTNSGTQTLHLGGITISGGDSAQFSKTQTCDTALSVDATCTVTVTFIPTSGGTKSASVTITDDAPGSPQSIPLAGNGTAPSLGLSPFSLSFGNQEVNTNSAPQSVTLTNSGNAALNISGIAITGSDAAEFSKVQSCGTSLAANANCTVTVTFSPTGTGARSAILTISDDASGAPHTVPLTGGGTAPALGSSPSSLSFGNQTVNTVSAPQSITLTNTGSDTLNLSGIALAGSDVAQFTKSQTCGSTLAVNANCLVTITFAPTSSGSKSASIVVTDDAPGSPHTLALSGAGTAPALSISAGSLSFGNQTVNTSSTGQSITLSNTGNDTLNISAITISGSDAGQFSKVQTCGITLAANANCTVTVTFTPTASGSRSAMLSVTDDAPGSPQAVALSGTGTAPALDLSVSSLAFGNQTLGASGPPQSITLTNSGTQSLAINTIAITGSDAVQFSKTQTCNSTLAISATCTVTVAFTPNSSGPKSALITIADDAAGSPHTVSVSGTGTAPALGLSPTSLSFGSQSVNTSSPPQSITLSNTGTQSLALAAVTLSGGDAAQFSKTQTCGSTLPVDGNCAVVVAFTPASAGIKSALITIADDAPGSPHTVSLSGTGTAPALGLSPASLSFGNQTVNTSSAPQPVTLSNTGTQSLALTAITISGGDAGQFSKTQTCGATLPVDASCTVLVTFAPTSAGTKSAVIAIADDAPGTPHTVALSAAGTAPALELSTSSLSFGNQAVNTNSAPQSVSLTNTGTEAVNISSIGLTGSDFGQFSKTQTCGSILPVGATCTVTVSFSPASPGSKTAAISIADNAGSGAQTIILSGTGTAPGIGISSLSLAFGNQTVNTASAAQVISITNTGNQSLNILSIAVTGANSSQFAKTQTCGAALPVAANCNISVVFSPTSAGVKSAAIAITDDASGSPHVVALSGNATAPPIPAVGISATILNFGNQALGTTAAQLLTLTNTGTAVLTINSLAISGTNANQFVKTQTCGATLAVGAACSVTATFSPTSIGAKSAAITITDNAANSPQVVSLAGAGVVPVSVSPVALNFGSTAVGTSSVPAAVLLVNNKNVPLSISSIALSGSNRASFSQSNTCGTLVAAAGSCTISVAFFPTGTGARSATLVITDNASNSPQNVSLAGSGVVAVTLSRTSVAFGSVTVGTTSSAQAVVLTNNKSVALKISSLTIGGTNPADFAQNNNCGTSVPPNSTCTITTTFKPVVTGARSAVMSITDDANNSPQTVSLSGSGIVAAAVSPTSLTFASQTVNTTSAGKTISLTNNKATALSISSIAITGTNRNNFSQTNNCGSSLAAKSTCTVTVKFIPSAKGTRTGTLTISDDASNSPQSVALTGTGK